MWNGKIVILLNEVIKKFRRRENLQEDFRFIFILKSHYNFTFQNAIEDYYLCAQNRFYEIIVQVNLSYF